jgi:hypothetical protein
VAVESPLGENGGETPYRWSQVPDLPNRFAVGDRVRVKTHRPGLNPRTPKHLWGKAGTVVELHGYTSAPHDHRGYYPFLYTISFEVSEITGRPSRDRVAADLHEEWLDPA